VREIKAEDTDLAVLFAAVAIGVSGMTADLHRPRALMAAASSRDLQASPMAGLFLFGTRQHLNQGQA
jgi:hypothetical protein